MQSPESFASAGNPLFSDLRFGWGNRSHVASERYLAACVGHALAAQGPILECGSGLSTALVAVIAKARDLDHRVLEHDSRWARKVQYWLDRYGLDRTVLSVNPLEDYGEYCWYQWSDGEVPKSLSLVLCDGPPGRTKGGRYGLVPLMGHRFGRNTVILLDDAGRASELAIAKRWAAELSAPFEVLGSVNPYIRMTVSSVR